MFNSAGPDRLALQQLREGELWNIVSKFASIIQSGKDVVIYDKMILLFMHLYLVEHR